MAILTCSNCGARNRVDESKLDRKPICAKCKTPLNVRSASQNDGHPITLTDSAFEQTLASAGDKPVLVDAWATWCPPCKMIAPTIDALASESAGRWIVAKLDVDQNPVTAQRFRIGSIPTLLIFKNGKMVEQLVGVHPKQTLLAKLEAHAK